MSFESLLNSDFPAFCFVVHSTNTYPLSFSKKESGVPFLVFSFPTTEPGDRMNL